MSREPYDMTRTSTSQPLTLSETDEAVLAACNSSDGAIEDCEESSTEVRYFFESGATGIVNRITGIAIVKKQRA
jgi:hypothetical protein